MLIMEALMKLIHALGQTTNLLVTKTNRFFFFRNIDLIDYFNIYT